MPFTFHQTPALSAEQQNPMAGLIKNALESYGKGVGAKYAKPTIEADIFSKKFLPLAQVASNPVAMSMMKDNGYGIMQMISQLLGGQGGQDGSPMMGGGSPGVNAMMGGGAQSQQGSGSPQIGSQRGSYQMTPQEQEQSDNMQPGDSMVVGQPGGQQKYDPSLPQEGGGLSAGAGAKATAPFYERPHTPNAVYIDPLTGKKYTDPAPDRIAASTQSIQAIDRVIPQLKDISKSSTELLEPGSGFNIGAAKAGNWMSRNMPGGILTPEGLKAVKIDPDIVSRQITFENKITSAAKDLMLVYPNLAHSDQSMTTLMNMMQPLPGESQKGYQRRVMGSAKMLNDRVSAMQQQMQPTEVTQNQQPSNQPQQPQQENEGGYTAQSFLARIPKMQSKDELREAFKTLSPELQKQVAEQLKRQG